MNKSFSVPKMTTEAPACTDPRESAKMLGSKTIVPAGISEEPCRRISNI